MIITRKTSAITLYFKSQLADNQTVAPYRCYRAKKMKKFSLEKVIEILKNYLPHNFFYTITLILCKKLIYNSLTPTKTVLQHRKQPLQLPKAALHKPQTAPPLHQNITKSTPKYP